MITSISQKEIKSVLSTLDRTSIFRIAKLCGIDVTQKSKVFEFIREYAPNVKVSNSAFSIAYYAPNYKEFKYGRYPMPHREPIGDAIRHARMEKIRGLDNYSKKLFIGNNNIYWCSPCYGFSDYNKGLAFPNTEKYRKVAETINRFLNFECDEN